jgi:hypothetical protein
LLLGALQHGHVEEEVLEDQAGAPIHAGVHA